VVGAVNANREYFESGVRDMAVGQAIYQGWMNQLLPHPVEGLDGYADAFHQLEMAREAISCFTKLRHFDRGDPT